MTDGIEMALFQADDPGAKMKKQKKKTPRQKDSDKAFKQVEPAAPHWHPDMKPFAILTDGTLTTDPAVIVAAREANMIAAEGLSLPSILSGGPFYQAAEIDGVWAIVPEHTVPGARSFPPFPGCYGINDLGPSRRF
jgi:hypothetical protein